MGRGRLRVSKSARLDMAEAFAYRLEQAGEVSARGQNRRFWQVFNTLASMPGAGRSLEEIAPGLRIFPANSFLILYRLDRQGVHILRVVHGSRDIPALLWQMRGELGLDN